MKALSLTLAALLLFSCAGQAQSGCMAQLQPLKPLTPLGCRHTMPVCLCDSSGIDCRWDWACIGTPGSTTPVPRLRLPPVQPSGIDPMIPLMVRPPAFADPLQMMMQIQTLRNLRQQQRMLESSVTPTPDSSSLIPEAAATKPDYYKTLYEDLLGLDPRFVQFLRTKDPGCLPREYPGEEQLRLFLSALKMELRMLDQEIERRRKASPRRILIDPADLDPAPKGKIEEWDPAELDPAPKTKTVEPEPTPASKDQRGQPAREAQPATPAPK